MAVSDGPSNGANGSSRKPLRIAVIPGDGIGQEVIPEGLACLRAVAKRYHFDIQLDEKFQDWATCQLYLDKGSMLPDDWKDTLKDYDAIYFGAVGDPALVPDHISLWGSLIQFRREFDQYISLRPARLLPGIQCPLVDKKIGDIDFWVVRENTEGEYSSIGGKMFPGTDREFVVQETVMTRTGVDRVLKYAFDLAQKRPRKKLTSATKSNGISISMPYWDERVKEMHKQYPDVEVDKYHIDILTAWLELIVKNLFGDILSDLGPACTGSIGVAPSGNINPTGQWPSLFEPVHGSANDIAGQGIANPIGAIWAAQMMLEHFGHEEAAAKMMQAIEVALEHGGTGVITPDLGGKGTCNGLGQHIADLIANL